MAFASPMELGAVAVRAGARFVWYLAQSERLKRVSRQTAEALPDTGHKVTPPEAGIATERQHLDAIVDLLRRDLANVRDGVHAMPNDEPGGLRGLISRTRAVIADAPEVTRRRVTGAHQEVFTDEAKGTRPRYYLQNFHFQTDGWMSDHSADIYDTQVDLLFKGAAGAMRRQGLRPISDFLHGKDQRTMWFADIACGSGAFLADLTRTFPRLNVLAVDMSEPYLIHARKKLGGRVNVVPCAAAAEDLPLPDASLDAASVIYLFHELPRKVRRQVARELARVIRPGGRLVMVDSLRFGDDERFDGLLELFPQLFHEPYYTDYCKDDLTAVFEEAGFVASAVSTAYLSRIMVLDRW